MTMTTQRALQIVADMASRFGENHEEGFSRRVLATDTDADCQAIADKCGGEYDADDVREIRDLWQAIEHVQAMQKQCGCEHFDGAVTDGKLTALCDVIIFG